MSESRKNWGDDEILQLWGEQIVRGNWRLYNEFQFQRTKNSELREYLISLDRRNSYEEEILKRLLKNENSINSMLTVEEENKEWEIYKNMLKKKHKVYDHDDMDAEDRKNLNNFTKEFTEKEQYKTKSVEFSQLTGINSSKKKTVGSIDFEPLLIMYNKKESSTQLMEKIKIALENAIAEYKKEKLGIDENNKTTKAVLNDKKQVIGKKYSFGLFKIPWTMNSLKNAVEALNILKDPKASYIDKTQAMGKFLRGDGDKNFKSMKSCFLRDFFGDNNVKKFLCSKTTHHSYVNNILKDQYDGTEHAINDLLGCVMKMMQETPQPQQATHNGQQLR